MTTFARCKLFSKNCQNLQSFWKKFWLENIKISTFDIKVSPYSPPELIVFSRIFTYDLSSYRINNCLSRISLEESVSDVL